MEPRLCSLCGENPVRVPGGGMMCEPCYRRVEEAGQDPYSWMEQRD